MVSDDTESCGPRLPRQFVTRLMGELGLIIIMPPAFAMQVCQPVHQQNVDCCYTQRKLMIAMSVVTFIVADLSSL